MEKLKSLNFSPLMIFAMNRAALSIAKEIFDKEDKTVFINGVSVFKLKKKPIEKLKELQKKAFAEKRFKDFKKLTELIQREIVGYKLRLIFGDKPFAEKFLQKS